jgi:CRISPR-associated protein Csx10
MIISIKLLSDLCCYSGEVYNTTVDTDVVYDDYGLPYIPAKRLKGCIREAALELYEMGLMPHYNAIFGKEGSDASAFTISNARLENYDAKVKELKQFEKTDFVNQQNVLSLYTYLRTQTAVDTNTGTAIENSLRTLRVLKKGLIFNANVDLENSEYFEEFKNAVSMVKHMGVSRTRGLGLVELKIKNNLSASVKHVLFKENELKDENKISYTIHLNSPLICKSAQGNQAKTEDYIAGSKVLGLIARSMGSGAYQKIMNDIVVSNAYVSLNGNRSLPGRNSLQKIKNQSYVDGKMDIVDMMYFKNGNDKEQRTPANIDYMTEKNEVLSVEEQISYHHQRPSDKSIGRATSREGQFYQLASICESQTFKGWIYANRETAKQIMDSVSKLGQVRMGYGRNSEFGQIDFTLDSVKDTTSKDTLIHDADLLLASDVILYNDNGMLVADVNVLKDYLNAYFGVDDIEIDTPFISYNTIGGFNVTWQRKKQIFSALAKASCMMVLRQEKGLIK